MMRLIYLRIYFMYEMDRTSGKQPILEISLPVSENATSLPFSQLAQKNEQLLQAIYEAMLEVHEKREIVNRSKRVLGGLVGEQQVDTRVQELNVLFNQANNLLIRKNDEMSSLNNQERVEIQMLQIDLEKEKDQRKRIRQEREKLKDKLQILRLENEADEQLLKEAKKSYEVVRGQAINLQKHKQLLKFQNVITQDKVNAIVAATGQTEFPAQSQGIYYSNYEQLAAHICRRIVTTRRKIEAVAGLISNIRGQIQQHLKQEQLKRQKKESFVRLREEAIKLEQQCKQARARRLEAQKQKQDLQQFYTEEAMQGIITKYKDLSNRYQQLALQTLSYVRERVNETNLQSIQQWMERSQFRNDLD